MSNIEKLMDFISEQDPSGQVFPAFCMALAMFAAAGGRLGEQKETE